MAGRLLSVTHVALGPGRVQLTLALQGQAIGTAAAYAIRNNLTPRQVANPEGEHIQRIRQQLLRDDVHVLGLRNNDPADFARSAQASATSELALDFGLPDEEHWISLDRSRAQVVPLTHPTLEAVTCYLKNASAEPVALTAELHEMRRIWDREPSITVSTQQVQVPAHFKGWMSLSFHAHVAPYKPHRVVLHAAPGISWARGTQIPTGTVAQYLYICADGPEEQNRHLPGFAPEEVLIPAYQHWWQMRGISLATRLTPQAYPFGTENVNNGCTWPEDLPNIWIADPAQPLPQAVELRFPQPTTCNTVLVSFDTNLDLTTGERPGFWRTPECVRDWCLYAQMDEQWQRIFEEQENYQRRRTVRFEPVLAAALKLEILVMNATTDATKRSACI